MHLSSPIPFFSALPRLVARFPLALAAMLLVLLPALQADEADEAAEAAAKPYPVDICLVTDEKLGSMGAPYVFVEEGYEVKFCCRGCVGSFNRNKEQFMTKLKEWHTAKEAGETITPDPDAADSADHEHHHH